MLFVLLAILVTHVFVGVTGELAVIPDDLYTYCPYSDICQRNASHQLDDDEFYKPCCSSCSCDPDCGLHLNCCYEELDQYKLIETLQLVCLSPGLGKIPAKSKQFYIVDKCISENGTVGTSCNHSDNQTNKQQLAPVSSKEKGLIYMNANCARCNNVYTYTAWNYYLKCKHTKNVYSPSEILQYGIGHDKCDILYLPPNDEDWSGRECYTSVNETCKTADTTLKYLCHHINAPFLKEDLWKSYSYDNVYCALCAGHYDSASQICLRNPSRKSSLSYNTIISGNIGIESLESLLTVHPAHQYVNGCKLNEVKHPYQDDCRYVYCPVGMVRIENECVYFTTNWTESSYLTQIQLRPSSGTKLKSTALMNILNNKNQANPKRWIRSPCAHSMSSIQVFSEINTTDVIQILILRLQILTESGFDPSIVMPALDECFTGKWLLDINGKLYPFTAELYMYKKHVQDGISTQLSVFSPDEIVSPQLYESIANGPKEQKIETDVVLTKMHFCEQIRLNISEVESGFEEIRILTHDLVIGDNMFNIYYEYNIDLLEKMNHLLVDYNKTSIAVCLEDFNKDAWGERQRTKNDCQRNGKSFLLYFSLVLFLNNTFGIY